MSFLPDAIRSLIKPDTVDYTALDFAPGDTAVPDETYVSVVLEKARLPSTRFLTQKYHAVVHGLFRYADRSAGERELLAVVSPYEGFQELDKDNIDRLVRRRRTLLGPVPYRGTLEMNVGLFSVKSSELAEPYLDLLSKLTELGASAYLSQAAPLIEPLRHGAEQLLGLSKHATLQTGLSEDVAFPLMARKILVARLPQGQVAADQLPTDAEGALSDEVAAVLAEVPYMVLSVEVSVARPDYTSLSDIRSQMEAVRSLALVADADTTARGLSRLYRTIQLSPDLITDDKHRLVARLQHEFGPVLDVARSGLESGGRPLAEVDDILTGGALSPARTAADPSVPRISLAELKARLDDPDVSDDGLEKYLIADKRFSRPFEPYFVPNPAHVDLGSEGELESAALLNWSNGSRRRARKKKFFRLRRAEPHRKVLVSEGDSWFQFPFFLRDVIDNLSDDYAVYDVGAAGDTLKNMVATSPEYLAALAAQKDDVRAFLFSGGGNDIVGLDEHKKRMVPQLLRAYDPAQTVAAWYIDTDEYRKQMRFIEGCYRSVILQVRAQYPGLPIIVHGYGRAIPGGYEGDDRSVFWAAQDEWIGRGLIRERGIKDPDLGKAIVHLLIDRFNELLISLAGGNAGGAFDNVWHVDNRAVVRPDEWADELHPSTAGFQKAARTFAAVIEQAAGD